MSHEVNNDWSLFTDEHYLYTFHNYNHKSTLAIHPFDVYCWLENLHTHLSSSLESSRAVFSPNTRMYNVMPITIYLYAYS